jgi:hypothetical protein
MIKKLYAQQVGFERPAMSAVGQKRTLHHQYH